jgi:uncharacterized membrane protein YebE (DUF533 family)
VFRTLINDAKSAAVSVVARYAVRASVAVPFLVAAGFGTAALTLMLVDRFGSLTAYAIMAGGFAAIGLVAALAVTVKEQEEEVADAAAEQNDTGEVATDAAAQAAVQLPLGAAWHVDDHTARPRRGPGRCQNDRAQSAPRRAASAGGPPVLAKSSRRGAGT